MFANVGFFLFYIYLPIIMLVTLRNYQSEAVEKIKAAYRQGYKAPILVLSTGSGKTIVFCNITERTAIKGNSVCILVHRDHLLRQTSDHLTLLGVPHGLIAPGHSMTGDPIQIASVMTLARRIHRMKPPALIVIDECHHTPAGTWKKILETWSSSRILGVTATPIRLDGKGLGINAGGFFDTMIEGPDIRWLIDNSYLSQPLVYAPPTNIDLKGIRTQCGDYEKHELSVRMDKPTITGSVIEHYLRLCPGAPAILFAASVKHAEHSAEQFNAAGIPAASLTGELSDGMRKHRISSLANGQIKILTSCEIISEGTDIPVVTAAILLRPTQSTGMFLQQCGRALRPFPGKINAIILDHVGNCLRHGLPDDSRAWELNVGIMKSRGPAKSGPSIKSCEKCFAVYSRFLASCPQCGHVNAVNEREIKQVDGELEQLTSEQLEKMRLRKQQGMMTDLAGLLAIARQRGYNPAWAHHVFNGRKAKEFKRGLCEQVRMAV